LEKNVLKIKGRDGNHNPRVGGSSPSSATKTSILCQHVRLKF
jgi:hypothetical protein